MGELVSIKGTRQGLIILFDSDADYEQIKDYLHKKMKSAKGFFNGAKFSLATGVNVTENQKSELEKICSEYGLIHDDNIKLPSFNKQASKDNLPTISKTKHHSRSGEKTLLIRRTLRSGQSIQYDGNVVVLGDVNAGSEIIAEGSIIVMGRLSGLIHAGATGNTQACVIANRLCPTQMRIGTAITTSPDEEPEYPEIARLVDNQIQVTKYIPSKK